MIIALLPVSVNAASKGKGPVLHMRFDEGGGPTAYDDGWTDTDSDGIKDSGESWNNNDGTLGAGIADRKPTWKMSGKIGGGLNFDGSNDYISIGLWDTITPLRATAGDWSYSAWIKTSNDGNVISCTDTDDFILLRVYGGKAVFFIRWTEYPGPVIHNSSATSTTDVNDGAWHHIAGVWSGDSHYIYVDGVQEGSSSGLSSFGPLSMATWSGTWTIGAQWDSCCGAEGDRINGMFTGNIDNVKIYDYARTPAQVMVDYNSGAAARLGSGTDPNEGNPPVLYLPFDENTGTTAYDRSGNDNNGSFVSVPAWAVGKHGSALDLDGIDDEVTLTDDATLQFGTGSYSFSLWLNIDQLNGTSDGIFEKGGWNNGTAGFRLSLANAKDFSITTGDGTNRVHTTALNGATFGHWFHLAIVVDRTNDVVKFYKDGVELTLTNSDISSVTGSTSSSEGMHIGWGANLETNNFFNGKIDEFKVYNYVRSQAQIAYDYNKGAPIAHYRFDEGGGTIAYNEYSSAHDGAAPVGWWRMDNDWTDSSGNGNTGTAGGNATFSTSSTIGPYCGTFDGTGDYVDCGTNSAFETGASGTFTYEAIINSSNYATTQTILSKSHPCSNYGHFAIQVQNNRVYLRFYSNLEANEYALYSDVILTNGQTYHIAWVKTWSQTGAKLYVNGVSQTVNGDTSARGTTYGGLHLFIGAEDGNHGGSCESTPFPYECFNGLIDDVRIYDYARTQEQIYNDYKNTHGTMVGNTKFVDGKIGKALEFDGSSDYVLIDVDDWIRDCEYITITGWYYHNADTGAAPWGIMTDSGGGAGDGFWWHIKYPGDIFYLRTEDSGGESGYTGTPFVSTGNWYHIATVIGTDTFDVYKDGGLYYSWTPSNGFSWSDMNSDHAYFLIGRSYYDSSTAVNGKLDDVKLYNYARTVAQIKQDYAISASRHGAKRTGVKDPWGGALPVGHWKLDENTGVLARDASENSNAGTLGGDGAGTDVPTWTQGKLGPGLEFDGDNDYVGIGGLSSAPSTAVTLAAWIKPDTVSGVHEIIDSNGGWCSMFQSGTAIHMQTGSTPISSTKGSAITAGNWHFVACTYDGSYIRNYVDGIEVGNTVASDGSIQGNNWNISRSGNTFSGIIDDVRVYNYAFTQAQVSWLYNRGAPVGRWRLDEATSGAVSTSAGAIKDDSVHNNNGTAAATTFSYAAGKFGGALSLDGNDYVEVAHDAAFDVNELTIVMWVKTPTSMGGMYGCFLSKQGAGRDYNFYARSPDSPYEKVEQFHFSAAWSGYTSVATLPVPYEPNTWHHVGVSVDATGLVKYYSDGVLILQTQGTPATANNDYPIWIGRGDNYWKGQVDDVRIYNYARTDAQIKQDCNAGAASRLGD